MFETKFTQIGSPLRNDFSKLKEKFKDNDQNILIEIFKLSCNSHGKIISLLQEVEQKTFSVENLEKIQNILSELYPLLEKQKNSLKKDWLLLLNMLIYSGQIHSFEFELIYIKSKETKKINGIFLYEKINKIFIFFINFLENKNNQSNLNQKISNLEARNKIIQKNKFEFKNSLSTNQNLLIKLNSNFETIHKIYDEILEILELFFDYKLPFLTSLDDIQNFSINYFLYIFFVLKYPSNFRSQRVEKMKDLISFGNFNDFHSFPFQNIYKSEIFNFKILVQKKSIYTSLYNEFSAIKLLLNLEYIDLLIIDPLHALENFLSLDGKHFIVEEFTINKNTEKNVTTALEKGLILILKDFDSSLKEIVDQISKSRQDRIVKYYVNKMILEENLEEFTKNEEIFLFNKKIQINPKFRMILVFHDEKAHISQELSSKVLIFKYFLQFISF